MPAISMDPIYTMHRSLLYTSFLYHDLREAVRYEEGSHVIRQWRLWLPIFLGTKCHNYATEAVNLIANIKADFPKHIYSTYCYSQQYSEYLWKTRPWETDRPDGGTLQLVRSADSIIIIIHVHVYTVIQCKKYSLHEVIFP